MQAALLPKLARLAGAGENDEFRKALRQLVMIVLGVGVIGVVGGFAVGHFAGRLLFGTKFTLGNRDVGLLAIGSGGFIFALTLAQALIALRSYAASALSWLAGAVGCVVGSVVAHDLFLRSELSFARRRDLRRARDARRAWRCACGPVFRWAPMEHLGASSRAPSQLELPRPS